MRTPLLPALCLTFLAHTALAQDPARSPAPPLAASLCQVSGVVKDPGGSPVPGGVVKIFDQTQLHQAAAGIATAKAQTGQGHYQLPPMPCGDKYTIQVESRGFGSTSLPNVSVSAPAANLDIVLYPSSRLAGFLTNPKWATFLLVDLYLLSIFLFRWHNIAIFDQKQLAADIAGTRARLEFESDPSQLTLAKAHELRKMLLEAEEPFKKFDLKNWLFWTRGDENSSWSRVREVQRRLIELWPANCADRLRARLETAEQELRASNDAPSLVRAESIKQTLLLEPPDEPHVERWKQLLGEALDALNSAREDEFSLLTIWQSKSTWLALLACALIQTCVAARGGATLMLVGAAGGLLSRLGRAIHSTNAPTDYAVSWTTLFLSPLLGALSGWFGILLINGFKDLGVINVPNLTVDALTPATLALAFVLGFSERLFDTLVRSVDQKLQGSDAAPVVAAAPSAAAMASAGAAAAAGAIVVKPAQLVAGQSAFITGSSLDEANIDAIQLVRDGKTVYSPKIDTQDSTSIQFTVPGDAAGKYTLVLSAKNSANPQTTVQVGDDPAPVPQPKFTKGADPNPAKPGATVTFTGTLLDSASATVTLLDAKNQPVPLTDLVQTATSIAFPAPTAPGEYTLVTAPVSGDPIRVKFTVAS